MKLLIVDDELYIVRALKANIAWEAIGIHQVFMAFNAQKAREIIQKEKVDIIITDIEMPQESGMELMRWVRANGYPAKALCLTCHAEFDYAAEAIRLGFREYYVKPVDFKSLEVMVGQIVQEILQEEKEQQASQKGELWEQNKELITQHFWEELIFMKGGKYPENIMNEAVRRNVEYRFDQQYSLILFMVRQIYERRDAWQNDPDLMEYVLANIAGEILLGRNEAFGRLGWKEHRLWVILEEPQMDVVMPQLQEYIEVCHHTAGIGMVGYVNHCVFGEELNLQYLKAVRADQENVRLLEGLMNVDECEHIIADATTSDSYIGDWYDMLVHQEFRAFYIKSVQYLDEMANISKDQLAEFVLNIRQVAYSYLLYMRIPASRLITLLPLQYEEMASRSTGDASEWLGQLVAALEAVSEAETKENEIIDQVKQYIQIHINERLRREDIAESVFISPGYLTRLFKQETGLSLFEYIARCRVDHARYLLEAGKYSIGEIAGMVGYDNFSYFSEIFKKHTGMSPSEYQKHKIFG